MYTARDSDHEIVGLNINTVAARLHLSGIHICINTQYRGWCANSTELKMLILLETLLTIVLFWRQISVFTK